MGWVRWSALGSEPLMGSVRSIAATGHFVYVSGFFRNWNSTNGLVLWDGVRWQPMIGERSVAALAVEGSNLLAGGRFHCPGFSEAVQLGRWDGINWTPLLTGTNDVVSSISVTESKESS